MRIKKERDMIFGSKIIELRKENHLSQQDLADKLDFDRTAIYNWERKGKETSYATLRKLSKIFGVSIDYLLGNEE